LGRGARTAGVFFSRACGAAWPGSMAEVLEYSGPQLSGFQPGQGGSSSTSSRKRQFTDGADQHQHQQWLKRTRCSRQEASEFEGGLVSRVAAKEGDSGRAAGEEAPSTSQANTHATPSLPHPHAPHPNPHAGALTPGEDGSEVDDLAAGEGAVHREWIDHFVNAMASSTSMDCARASAGRALRMFQKRLLREWKGGVAHKCQELERENAILKRAVAIQNERLASHHLPGVQKSPQQHPPACSDRLAVEELKRAVAVYQEQVRCLEVANYSLRAHLRQQHLEETNSANQAATGYHPNRDIF